VKRGALAVGAGTNGGSHYRFDHLAGHQIGRSVAEFVAANVMGPGHHWDD
jgi:hypothetical protein